MARTSDDFVRWLTALAVQDGAVCIAPWPNEFMAARYDFLNGLKRFPARISAPEGRDPFAAMLHKPGKFLILWIPDADS